MPFTLRINFAGLCLFAPEVVQTGPLGRMHVLMPNAVAHAHCSDRHIPVLFFNIAHLNPNAPAVNMEAQYSMRGRTLNFGGSDALLNVCAQVVNLRPVTRRPISPRLFGKDVGERLAARVTLGQGRMRRVAPGFCWTWDDGEVRRIAHQAVWEIEYPTSNSLKLEAVNFAENDVQQLPELHPVTLHTGEEVIDLFIHHVPSAELPPDRAQAHELSPGTEAPHFSEYYRLFGGPVPVRIPRFWSKNDDAPPTSAGDCELIGSKGEEAYNCMLAGAW